MLPPGLNISLSDDEMFAAESMREAIEAVDAQPPKAADTQPSPFHLIFHPITVLAGVMAMLAAGTWNHVERLMSYGMITCCLLLLVFLPRTTAVETAYTGHEHGMIRLGNIRSCVDSGCTSTSIPIQLRHLIDETTNNNPQQQIFVANDVGLPIVEIGKMNATVHGYRLDEQGNKIPGTGKLKSSCTLVVDGMTKDRILLSTRGMKKDGIKTTTTRSRRKTACCSRAA